jgi:hypothetical protein
VTIAAGGSTTLAPDLGRFRLVTIGRAFHWMDRPDTLRRLDALVVPGGVIALFDDDHARVPDNAWVAGWEALLGRYNGDDPVRAAWRGPDWVRHEAILLDGPFPALEEITILDRRRIGLATLVDRALSMSSTAASRLGARTAALVADIGDWFAEAAPDGTLVEVIAASALLAGGARRRAGHIVPSTYYSL